MPNFSSFVTVRAAEPALCVTCPPSSEEAVHWLVRNLLSEQAVWLDVLKWLHGTDVRPCLHVAKHTEVPWPQQHHKLLLLLPLLAQHRTLALLLLLPPLAQHRLLALLLQLLLLLLQLARVGVRVWVPLVTRLLVECWCQSAAVGWVQSFVPHVHSHFCSSGFIIVASQFTTCTIIWMGKCQHGCDEKTTCGLDLPCD
jgi:hypothetical protein